MGTDRPLTSYFWEYEASEIEVGHRLNGSFNDWVDSLSALLD